jgi:hypothetical protein
MQFPLSRDDLLNYRNNVLHKEQIDARVNKLVNVITSNILNTLTTTNDHKYVYDATNDLVFDKQRYTTHLPQPSQQQVINVALENLKQKFPDSKIIVDPLLKIITVDWSKMGPADWKG